MYMLSPPWSQYGAKVI